MVKVKNNLVGKDIILVRLGLRFILHRNKDGNTKWHCQSNKDQTDYRLCNSLHVFFLWGILKVSTVTRIYKSRRLGPSLHHLFPPFLVYVNINFKLACWMLTVSSSVGNLRLEKCVNVFIHSFIYLFYKQLYAAYACAVYNYPMQKISDWLMLIKHQLS